MKFSGLFLILWLPSLNLCAQETPFYGKAVYRYKFNFSSLHKDTLTSTLYFTSNGESYYVSPYRLTLMNGIKNANKDNSIISETRDSTIVYRDPIHKKHLFHIRSGFSLYLVNDTLQVPKWELKPGFKQIGRFRCKSATGKVSGRVYTVWYTTEIPISTGPWKIFGLPGLVIEALDEEKLVWFQLANVEFPISKSPRLDTKDLYYQSTPRSELDHKTQKDFERREAFAESMGVKVRVRTVSKGLELEY